MKSLRTTLINKGLKLPFSISCFQSYPKSLKELIRILEITEPEINKWGRPHTNFDEGWTNEFQGLTYAGGGIWYFSNRDEILKVNWASGENLEILKRFSRASLGLGFEKHHHFGDITYYNPGKLTNNKGMVLVPIEVLGEYKDEKIYSRILSFSEDLDLIGWANLYNKLDHTNNGCCAVNPWDNCLYVSDDNTDFFYRYDIKEFIEKLRIMKDWGTESKIELITEVDPKTQKPIINKYYLRMVSSSNFFTNCKKPGDTFIPEEKFKIAGSVQGIVFSKNGRIYVSQAIVDPVLGIETWNNYLNCFDTLTGLFLEGMEVDHPDSTNVGEEFQGITINEDANKLCIAYLDNDVGGDEIDIMQFSPPDFNHII